MGGFEKYPLKQVVIFEKLPDLVVMADFFGELRNFPCCCCRLPVPGFNQHLVFDSRLQSR
jgi:predicted RNA-binding protein